MYSNVAWPRDLGWKNRKGVETTSQKFSTIPKYLNFTLTYIGC